MAVRRALVALGTVLTLGAVLLVEQRSSGPAGAEDMKGTPGERAGGGDGGTVRAGGADEGPRGAVTIALAGDVHLEGVLAELDDQSGSTLGPMSRALSTADVAVVNLESAISDGSLPMAAKELVDAYGGDDDRSMAADNTSAYNCRAVTGGSTFSDHAYGKAIDINPVRNPYVLPSGVLPPAGRAYADVDRSPGADAEPGVIVAGDVVVRAFTSRGWEWGASFADYQHFSTN